jgi:hypothetical protein
MNYISASFTSSTVGPSPPRFKTRVKDALIHDPSMLGLVLRPKGGENGDFGHFEKFLVYND